MDQGLGNVAGNACRDHGLQNVTTYLDVVCSGGTQDFAGTGWV